jgi:hypothetical protein
MLDKTLLKYNPDLRESNRRGGFYWMKGKPYVSVTNVLKVLDKPALVYWSNREIYRAMMVNPGLSQEEAMAAPYKTSDAAKSRGTTVHSLVENYKHGLDYLEKVDAFFKPYAEAFHSFVEDHKLEVIENERSVISKKYGYAGTLDMLAHIGGTDKVYIFDIKTGKDVYPEAFLQMSAYRQALDEAGVKVDGMGVILLKTGQNGKPTGTYKFEQGEDCFPVFKAALEIWKWKNADLIESIKKNIKPYTEENADAIKAEITNE